MVVVDVETQTDQVAVVESPAVGKLIFAID